MASMGSNTWRYVFLGSRSCSFSKLMTRPLLLFLFLAFAFKAPAQEEKPTPFERIVAGMKGIDTFMVYGDLCSGCIRGTTKRIHVLWKEKGTVWIRSYEYWYQFENVVRTRKVPYGKDPFAFYEANRKALDFAIKSSELLPLDTTVVGDGQILVSVGIMHGSIQRIYVHYPNQTLESDFCCGPFEWYKKKAPQLVSFFDLFPKELNTQDISLNPDPNIYTITR